MKKFRILYKSAIPSMHVVHIDSTSREEAEIIVNKYHGNVISTEEVSTSDTVCATPAEILELLNKMYSYYDEICSTEERNRVDALRRFFCHMLAFDEISEEYIREIVE